MEQSYRGVSRENAIEGLEEAAILMVRHLAVRSALGLTANLTLGTLDREGPARVTTLAVAANIGQPAMTELVQRLERQSLVTRVDDPGDGRAALVTVTNAGRALLDDQRRDRRDRMAEMLAALSADEEVTLTLAMHVALPRHPATHRRRSKVPHADKRRHPDQPVADISQKLPIGDRRSDLGDVGSEAADPVWASRAIGRSFSFVVSEAIPC